MASIKFGFSVDWGPSGRILDMDEPLMPAWMKEQIREEELKQAKEEAAGQRAIAASLLLEKDRPKFWKSFHEKLAIAVPLLPRIPRLKLMGSISEMPNSPTPALMITMRQESIYPNDTYVNLFMDANAIRCTTLADGVYRLAFGLTGGNEVIVTNPESGRPMDPEEASQYVIKRMMGVLERQSGSH